jgi:hypothetical protein
MVFRSAEITSTADPSVRPSTFQIASENPSQALCRLYNHRIQEIDAQALTVPATEATPVDNFHLVKCAFQRQVYDRRYLIGNRFENADLG